MEGMGRKLIQLRMIYNLSFIRMIKAKEVIKNTVNFQKSIILQNEKQILKH